MHFARLKRREFMTLLGGTAAWPLAARAQQPNQMRRIGVLIPFSETDSETQALLAAFKQRFQELGWNFTRSPPSAREIRLSEIGTPSVLAVWRQSCLSVQQNYCAADAPFSILFDRIT
jgi:hypothetical protein